MMTAKKTNDENIWPVHNEVRSADLQFHKEMRKKEKKISSEHLYKWSGMKTMSKAAQPLRPHTV